VRTLATISFSFALAVVLAEYVLPPGWLLPFSGGLLLVGILTALLRLPILKRRRYGKKRILLTVFSLAAGLLYFSCFTQWVHQPAAALCGADHAFSGTVCDYPTQSDGRTRATLLLEGEGLHHVKAILYGDEQLLTLAPGQRVSGQAHWQDASVIHDTDVTTFTSRGVHVLLYQGTDLAVTEGKEGSWRYLPQQAAKAVQEKICRIYDSDPICAAFMTAELTGDRSLFSTEDYTQLSQVGMAHLFAVSGLHCAFLVSLIGFIIPPGRRRLFAVTAIASMLFYMLMVGLTPSVVRACIMQIFLLTAPLCKRESDGLTALGSALLVLLAANPFAIGSVSLQLSFAATLGLVTLAPKIMESCRDLGKKWPRAARMILRFVLASAAVTVSALVFTAPLTAYYFNILALVSPLSNLLIVWAAGWSFMLGFVTVLIGFVFLPAAQVLSVFSSMLIYYVHYVAGFLAKLPFHAVYFSNRLLLYWMAYCYAMLIGCYLIGGRKRRYAAASVLAVLTLIAAVKLNTRTYYGGDLNIMVMDVGQGESVALYTGTSAALVDCGSSSGTDPGSTVADMLETMGIHRLSYFLVTHYHADHADGLEELLARMPVDKLLLPNIPDQYGVKDKIITLADKYGIATEYVEEPKAYSLDGATLTAYPPVGSGSLNERGLSALCTLDGFDALFTGDMDGKTEEKLVSEFQLPDIEVLLVGHHGSLYSSSAAFLEAVRPETAVISVGKYNSYGQPTEEALDRLQEAGAAVYRTDLQGNIMIAIQKGDP